MTLDVTAARLCPPGPDLNGFLSLSNKCCWCHCDLVLVGFCHHSGLCPQCHSVPSVTLTPTMGTLWGKARGGPMVSDESMGTF